ncbi:putative sulfate exporter family transporter [Vibrio sp. SS-MA-C1-2]|uniref:YeiH family protein n=1 Tax=Vibrio sp. SS-MA-C1-2 TaxID=2908646 RepID=UPI001F238F8A|nr:putative sulfate exporter family transporter [Vibrio sp. SS-MA-C1-2]UJF18170.1 putative sulfate exporter family transporter [Vibrio sp. SS-MA-C1-2]
MSLNISLLFQKKSLPFTVLAFLALTPFFNSPIALISGFILSLLGLIPKEINIQAWTKKLLSYSIIGLGFGINLDQAISVTSHGLGLIVSTIAGTLIIGMLITKALKLESKTGYLIASGTAICGGSAIAAVSPAINARGEQTALALAVVFVLNSIALVLFPLLGHWFGLSQQTFGMWSAVAIHDTSSVVGAASAYGEEALKIATTLKLARALWIIPVAFISAILFKSESKKITLPYFIFFYCAAILTHHYVPQFESIYHTIFVGAKQLLILALFLIGCGISIQKLKQAGIKPLILGVSLWIIIATSSLIWLILTN